MIDLHLANLQSLCHPEIREKITHWTVCSELPSTHDYLLQNAPIDGAAVCICDTQTAGHGRQGRGWYSPPGAGIYLSFSHHLLQNSATPALGLVAAIALAQTLRAWKVPCSLKWPNDIWVGNRKLAGVLAERLPHSRVIFSCGLNIQHPHLPAGATDLATIWQVSDALTHRSALAVHIISAWVAALAQFEAEGFTHFYRQWADFDLLAAKKVVVHTPSATYTGLAQGISAQGALRVAVHEDILEFYQASVRPISPEDAEK